MSSYRLHKQKILDGGGRYHIETSPLVCSANQWTGFYMITAFVMKELSDGNMIWASTYITMEL